MTDWPLRLIQYRLEDGTTAVAQVTGDGLRPIAGYATTYALVCDALATGRRLADLVADRGQDHGPDYDALIAAKRVLPPLTHPDPAHLLITGTGLTHLGSAETRQAMHAKAEAPETDSMRMFRLGLDGGKPAPDEIGVQPEWFYKGDGRWLVAPEQDLWSPAFALDGGEEPEIAGVYMIADNGTPYRIGFALANEFSDHVMERQNYLYLAHSKLRPLAFGPELLVGDLPAHIEGTSRIRRDGAVVWEKPFLSGEANMSHTLANLEQHHFKYAPFRWPGDVHVHCFGTATLSFADGVRTRDGDVFEIACALFGHPLRNRRKTVPADTWVIRSM